MLDEQVNQPAEYPVQALNKPIQDLFRARCGENAIFTLLQHSLYRTESLIQSEISYVTQMFKPDCNDKMACSEAFSLVSRI